ncbi:MAG: hypothetical protein ACUVX8_04840 [Candidatus Zipacnadales bacterium]
MSDLRDRINGDETAAERILDWIPGFKGYRDRENRREADRMVRDYLANLLSTTHSKLRDAVGDLAKQGRLKHISGLDSLSKRIEKLTDLIRYADAGYTGWFAAVKIREAELDRLYEYDVSLKQFIADAEAAVMELLGLAEEDMPVAIAKVETTLDELEHMVKNRKQIALSLVP